jgi:hypothetical protein
MPRYKNVDGVPLGRRHLHTFKNVLRPRGGVRLKESLSGLLADSLAAAFDEWTDLEYADSRDPEAVADQVRENLRQEVVYALDAFRDHVEAHRQG